MVENLKESANLHMNFNIEERFTILISFLFGLFINYGTINLLGFMLGFNHNFIMNKKNFREMSHNLMDLAPAFIIGMLLVQINMFYFAVSLLLGYGFNKYEMRLILKNYFRTSLPEAIKHNSLINNLSFSNLNRTGDYVSKLLSFDEKKSK